MAPLLISFILILLLNLLICVRGFNLDISKTRIWGPGLYPERIVLPARYFFIHAVDKNNVSLQHSPGDIFKVKIVGKSPGSKTGNIRTWIQVLDRKDGLFIVRYKLYHTIQDLEIHVLCENEHVPGSPFISHGLSFAEECTCPRNDLNGWLEDMECPKYEQIEKDLKIFKRVKFSKLFPVIMQRFNQPESMSICNYIVKDNQIHRRCFGKHVGFKIFMDAILLSLSRKTMLPDMEFFVNLGDWPLSPTAGRPQIPLFSWCGSDDTIDIHLPTYDITESSLQCMGRVMLDMLSVQTSTELKWQERQSKAFWRGRDSRRERLHLVELSRKHPGLLNASLTNFFFFPKEEEIYGPKEKHISFFKFFDYKYQINVDGTVAAYRFPYLLGGGSAVLKQDSKYHEHFYSLLEPWIHYIPVRNDLSDLMERIHWAHDNDDKALKIALAGQKFALDNLLPLDIFCYHGRLFREWANRLVESVEIRPEMELVPQPSETLNCFCDKISLKTKKDEL